MLRGQIPPKFSITAGRSFCWAFFLPSALFAGHFPYRAFLSRHLLRHSLRRCLAHCPAQHCQGWPDILCGRLRKDFGLTVRACSAVVSGWGRSALITLAAGSPLR